MPRRICGSEILALVRDDVLSCNNLYIIFSRRTMLAFLLCTLSCGPLAHRGRQVCDARCRRRGQGLHLSRLEPHDKEFRDPVLLGTWMVFWLWCPQKSSSAPRKKLKFEFLEMRKCEIWEARRRRQSEDSQFFSQQGISTRDRGGKRGSGDREQRPPSASEARGSGRNQSRNTSAMVKFLKVRDGRRALELEGGERRGPGPPASGACEASFRAGACSSSRPLFYSPPPPMGRSH